MQADTLKAVADIDRADCTSQRIEGQTAMVHYRLALDKGDALTVHCVSVERVEFGTGLQRVTLTPASLCPELIERLQAAIVAELEADAADARDAAIESAALDAQGWRAAA